jgi:hypothetical protein
MALSKKKRLELRGSHMSVVRVMVLLAVKKMYRAAGSWNSLSKPASAHTTTTFIANTVHHDRDRDRPRPSFATYLNMIRNSARAYRFRNVQSRHQTFPILKLKDQTTGKGKS